MSKHTPGPWRYDFEIGYCGEIIAGGGTTVCTFDDRPTPDDTRLIAAAPDLLAVCQELEQSAEYWSEYDVPLGIVDRIKSAIAKATGGAA